jgi:hypothetical protein
MALLELLPRHREIGRFCSGRFDSKTLSMAPWGGFSEGSEFSERPIAYVWREDQNMAASPELRVGDSVLFSSFDLQEIQQFVEDLHTITSCH